ncbi:hypothetical protein SAY87_000954 [Trapa incisa]|uniref:Uncharacterized protein n=1 Tax=Trapa incisa TaxID=236973 RepID=A0AAN7GMY9_9MYRT|nr:hypothetical protein SAY87_000954 [Trapa incisa]
MDLGNKASLWSRKHLNMTAMSMEESQEEKHSEIFFQLLLDVLNFSAASFSALTHTDSIQEVVLMDVVERSFQEQLDLIKVSMEYLKKLEARSSDILKASQLVIDSIIRFCSEQCQVKDWTNFAKCPEVENGSLDCEGPTRVNPVVKIWKCVILKLCDLGILASKDGGHLVSILNTSWKGVVRLLQQGKGSLEVVLNVSNIILELISLACGSLRMAATSWSSASEGPISVAVARRAFIPVKFYLVNAVKISSIYPTQAFHVHRGITLCATMISCLRISLSKERNFKIATELISELLEPMTMSLLYSILNSDEVKEEMKFEILDSLFTAGCNDSSRDDSCGKDMMQLGKIFSEAHDSISSANALLLGRILLFICLLRFSINAEENVKLGITRKLEWLFNMLIEEEVYAFIFSMQIPLSYGTKEKMETVWEPLFCSLLVSLKTFTVTASCGIAWGELISFLLYNIFHPHLICQEIIMDILCFLMRYAENSVVNDIIDKLCSCFKSVAHLPSLLDPGSAARKIARSLSLLAKCGTQSAADQVYGSIIGENRSQLSSVMLVAFLMEGFSMQLLSDSLREIAKRRIITDYCAFMGTSYGRYLQNDSCILSMAPVFVLSASLPSTQFDESDINKRTLKFLFAIMGILSESTDPKTLENCHSLLAETLRILSNMKNQSTFNEMDDVILQLHGIFMSKACSDAWKWRSKGELALFMAGFSYMEISETEECKKSSALRSLYHMLLKERHWALAHLALASFGYFAARTSCNQMWKFVPENAALSFDLLKENKVNEERFMSEFKAFLEKDAALHEIAPTSDLLQLLQAEAMLLKEATQKKMQALEIMGMDCEVMEANHQQLPSKRRKLPVEISKGVDLLQSGMRVMGEGLTQWQKAEPDSPELHDKFVAHFACLQDAIANLASISGSGNS